MKKLALTIAIVLTMGLGASAQSLLGWDDNDLSNDNPRSTTPVIPASYGSVNDANGNGETTPLGSGIAVLVGLGAAYALKKRKVK